MSRKISLADSIFNFLNQKKIIKLCDKLINKYSSSKELYMNLRSESIKLVKRSKTYYKVFLDPHELELWIETKKYTNFKPDNDDAHFENLWPSGDYNTYGDFYDMDDLKPLIYSIETDKKFYFKNWNNIDIQFNEEPLDYQSSIYICFIIPFIMAKHSLNYNPKPPNGTFIFLTNSGGAGALVKTKRNGLKAISCGHTFDLDNDGTKLIRDKKYIIMVNDGTLAIISKAKIKYNLENEIDAGMADVITHLDTKYFIDIESNIVNKTEKIICYGSPSIIKNNDDNCGLGREEDILIGPSASKKPGTDITICWWDPLFFHPKDGIIIQINKQTIYHNAILWQGMSGGPLFTNQGKLFGLHHLEDDGFDDNGKKVTEPYGIAMRVDIMENLLYPIKRTKTKPKREKIKKKGSKFN